MLPQHVHKHKPGKFCVTAFINRVDFNATANVGDVIIISARITRAFKTSLEIFVLAFARTVLTGKSYLISEVYFTFVALDEKGEATEVIAVKPVTASEKKFYNAAFVRRKKDTQCRKSTQ